MNNICVKEYLYGWGFNNFSYTDESKKEEFLANGYYLLTGKPFHVIRTSNGGIPCHYIKSIKAGLTNGVYIIYIFKQ